MLILCFSSVTSDQRVGSWQSETETQQCASTTEVAPSCTKPLPGRVGKGGYSTSADKQMPSEGERNPGLDASLVMRPPKRVGGQHRPERAAPGQDRPRLAARGEAAPLAGPGSRPAPLRAWPPAWPVSPRCLPCPSSCGACCPPGRHPCSSRVGGDGWGWGWGWGVEGGGGGAGGVQCTRLKGWPVCAQPKRPERARVGAARRRGAATSQPNPLPGSSFTCPRCG